MSSQFFTIGYQGIRIEAFIACLNDASVSLVVDTRDTPTSRRVEYRRHALAGALDAVGIAYLSIPSFGAPRALRGLVSDWERFAGGYRERLADAREEIEQLLPLIESGRVCLLCFEEDPAACHRSLLAHEIKGLLDTEAIHLRPGRVDKADDHERPRMRLHGANNKNQVAAG